jgi:hypothetical protein
MRFLGFLAIGAFIVWMIFDKAHERAGASVQARRRRFGARQRDGTRGRVLGAT